MRVFVLMEKNGPRVYAEGRGCRLCIVQGCAQAFGLGELAGVLAGADQLALEEIPELSWCCTGLQMIHRGCSPAYRWHVPGYPSAV